MDTVDEDILFCISSGMTNVYSIWSLMKDEAIATKNKERYMAYKNVRKRVMKLASEKIIENIILKHTTHRSKDYKISDNGMKKLEQRIQYHNECIKKLKKTLVNPHQ